MNGLTGLALLLQDARRDGWRSLLTVLALALVLVTYLATAALAASFAAIRENALTAPHNLLLVSADVLDLTDSEIFPAQLEAAAHAAAETSPGAVGKASALILRHLRIDGRIYQVTAAPLADLQDVYQLRLEQGAWPARPGEIAVTATVTALTGKGPGGVLDVFGSPFTITAVVDAPGNRGGVWMSYPDGQALFGPQRGFQIGVLQILPGSDPATVQAALESRPGLDGLAVYQEKQFAEVFTLSTTDVLALTRVFNLLALVVICFGAYNITQVNLLERSHEIGVLRAIGFSPRSVQALLLARTLLFTLAGFGVAWLSMSVYFGLRSQPVMVYVNAMDMRLTPAQTAMALGLCLAFSALGAWLPGAALLRRPAAALLGEAL